MVCHPSLAEAPTGAPEPAVAGGGGSTFTNAAQILALSNDEANARPPVQIRGMVTYYEHGMALFVQDETGGIFVYHTGGPLDVRPGQYVEVNGVANRGRYSRIIDSPRIRSVGTGPEVHPRSVSLGEIYGGGLDAQWVELTGVVRQQKLLGGGLRIELAVPRNRIMVWIPTYAGGKPPELAGSIVTVRGVVGTTSTDQGQLAGFQIFANTLADCKIIQQTPEDPFSSARVLVRDLKDPKLRMDGVGRVWTRGIVTLCWPGRDLFVQDSSGGVEIRTGAPFDEVPEGSVIEVAGFLGPVLDPSVLEDAVIRKVGTDHPVQAAQVLAEDVLKGLHSHELVEIEATFLQWADTTSSHPTLALQAQGHLMTAIMEVAARKGSLPPIEPGSRLRLTGVCGLDPGLSGTQPAMHLLLRSSGDIKIVEAPQAAQKLWTEAPMFVASLAGVGLVAAWWNTRKQRRQTERILQVQANLQTEMLQGEQQLRRSMEERDRMGRDLHDDIIQSIYSVGLILEDCRRVVRQSPQKAEARVASAIDTLNNTIRSVRGFLAGLEPKVLNGRELKTALKSLALTSGDGPTPFQIEVDPPAANSLTSLQATQLLHIAKEAMSNSLRHGGATSIAVSLHPVTRGVRLEVRDNGSGFDPEALAGMGHGLRNMTGRAREIGAELQIVSAPGQGCSIVVTVPQRNLNEPG